MKALASCAQPSGSLCTSACFRMLLAVTLLHLLLDLCTFAGDCGARKHLYLWPFWEHSYHLNCLVGLLGVAAPQSALRFVRVALEVLFHLTMWSYVWGLKTNQPMLAQWLGIVALPGYFLEELGPRLIGVPTDWGNMAFFTYVWFAIAVLVHNSGIRFVAPPKYDDVLNDDRGSNIHDHDQHATALSTEITNNSYIVDKAC